LSIQKWNDRYRAGEQVFRDPAPLVEKFAGNLAPGVALDLACGPGRNALFLAARGWEVTAVDGSPIAIDLLRERARSENLSSEARIADLERAEFEIAPASYDLICSCYYFQRDLIPALKNGVKPGGLAIVIVHLMDSGEIQPNPYRARAGELREYFSDWTVLHDYEGQPHESCHAHQVAELVARKPDLSGRSNTRSD